MNANKFAGGFVIYPINFNTTHMASAVKTLLVMLKQRDAGYHIIYLKKWESIQLVLGNSGSTNVTLGSEVEFLKYFKSTFNTYFMNQRAAPTVNPRSTIDTPDHDIIYVFSKLAEITQEKNNESDRNQAVSLYAMNKIVRKIKRSQRMLIYSFFKNILKYNPMTYDNIYLQYTVS